MTSVFRHPSRDAVRYGGMDITVHPSDLRRAPGNVSRHGSPALRWARRLLR
jgi:hypothetical protein